MVAVYLDSSFDNINVAPIRVPVCYGRDTNLLVSSFGEEDRYKGGEFGRSIKDLIKKIKNSK